MKKIFISRKKLIKMLKEMQLEERRSNQNVKLQYCHKNDEENNRKARDMQFYEDGNDNAFNWIIGRLERGIDNESN